MEIVTNNLLDKVVGYCFHYFGSGWWLPFPLFWIRLLVTVPIILDQAVGECSHYFSHFLDQAVGYCSHYFESACW
jgi:hypothetical protein